MGQSTGLIRALLQCVLTAALAVGGLHLWPVDVSDGEGRKPRPTPTPTPAPLPPAPIPVEGLRVLIVFETADLAKLPSGQQAILYGQTFRDYLDSVCVLGSDNKTHEWQIGRAHV